MVDLSRFFDYEQPGNAPVAKPQDKALFLARANREQWERLAACCTVRRFRAGETVVREGDTAQSLYIVARGALEVRRGEKVIAPIPEGSVFGEQAFFDGELMELGAGDLEKLAARDPQLARNVLFDLGRILSLRLRAATDVAALVRR